MKDIGVLCGRGKVGCMVKDKKCSNAFKISWQRQYSIQFDTPVHMYTYVSVYTHTYVHIYTHMYHSENPN